MIWTPHVQRGALRGLVEGKLGEEMGAVVPRFYSGKIQTLVEGVQAHVNEFGAIPTWDSLEHRMEVNGTLEAIEEIGKCQQLTKDDVEFVCSTARESLKGAALFDLAEQVAEVAEEDPTKAAHLTKLVAQALRVGDPAGNRLSLAEDQWSIHDQSEAALRGYPTGVQAFEDVRPGGLHRGEVGAILAGTKVGKSQFLVWLGCQAAKAGHPVLFFSLEMQPINIARRVGRCLTGYSSSYIMQHKEAFELAFDGALPNRKHFRIVHYPRRSVGVATLKEQVEKVLEFDSPLAPLVCLDYASLLRGSGGERHREVGDLYADISAAAQEYDVGVWTPFQLNRSGAQSQDPDLSNAGESFEAVQHLDFVIGLAQDQAQKSIGHMTLKGSGTRESGYFQTDIEADWSVSRIKEVQL